MLKTDAQSRLYCAHYIPSNTDCPDCHSTEKDYLNRPLYAPLYVPVPNLPTVLDNSQIKLPNTFYVPFNEKSNNQKGNDILSDDCVEMKTKNGTIRVPQSTLIYRSHLNQSATHNNQNSTRISTCNLPQTFPSDFQNHAHRFTRSFSWKTKPEESPYAQMQPLPKLIKRPGYVEICCKNICWPTHQLCLCCGRNTAESCRKWSKSTEEYDYIDACWSSCALCSDDAYKILNTPVVYNEKIIDPEVLLPLDAELLYYSIQSAKRQQEKEQKSFSQSIFAQQQQQQQQQQSKIIENSQDNPVPFTINTNDLNEVPHITNKNDLTEVPSILQSLESNIQSETFNVSSQEQQLVTPLILVKEAVDESKQPHEVKPKKSSQSVKKKTKKPAKKSNRSKKHSKKRSTQSQTPSKQKSNRSRSRSKQKSRSKTVYNSKI